MKLFFKLILFCFCHQSLSNEVAFMTVYNRANKQIRLNSKENFFHILIKYNNLWYHAGPQQVVRGIKDFKEAGFDKFSVTILTNDRNDDFGFYQLNQFVGLPYDYKFNWSNKAIYCSELVAKLLNIEPRPMVFDPRIWPKAYQKYAGLPGISPDHIFYELISRGYRLDTVLPSVGI